MERVGPCKQREKLLHMASYLPILAASLGSRHVLNITSQLKPTEGLHDQKRLVPLGKLIWGLLRLGFYPFK